MYRFFPSKTQVQQMILTIIDQSIKRCKKIAQMTYQSIRHDGYGILFGLVLGLSACDDESTHTDLSMPYANMQGKSISQEQALIGVWGIKKDRSDQLFVVGGSQNPPTQVILTIHQNQIKKTQRDGEPLWWVFGLNDTDIWTCGGNGTILKIQSDGTAIKEEIDLPQEMLEKTILWGLWGSDINNMWAVGGSASRGGPKGLILKRDSNGVWHRVTDPILPLEKEDDPLAGLNLYKVWGQSTSKVWLVGEGGRAYFWDGTQFSQLEVRSATTQTEGPLPLIFTLSGNQEYIWAVGGYDQGFSWKLNLESNDTWMPEVFAWKTPPLNGVFTDENEVFMVGQQGSFIYQNHQHSQTYQRYFIQNAEDLTLHAVWKGNYLWIVGGDLEAFQRGVLISNQPLTDLDSE